MLRMPLLIVSNSCPTGCACDVRLIDVGRRNPGHAAAAPAGDQGVGALGDHAVAVALQAVTRRAVDAETLLAALHRLLR